MTDLLELSVQYRCSAASCRFKAKELTASLNSGELNMEKEIAIKREITMLTAMNRDCVAISNYLKKYFEGRQRLDKLRKQGTGK